METTNPNFLFFVDRSTVPGGLHCMIRDLIGNIA